jgi:succinoglycan biosynthesis transport protein ExoP
MDAPKSNELAPLASQPYPPSAQWASVAKVPRGGLNSTPDILSLVKALRRRWSLALGLGVIAAALAGPAVYLLTPPAKYTAGATIEVALNPKRIMWEPGGGTRDDPKVYQQTQAAFLTDRFVLTHALSKPDVAKLPLVRTLLQRSVDPEEWLDANLQANFVKGSEILEVTLSGDHPQDLPVLINSTLDSYMSLIIDEERKERAIRLVQLESLWNKYQKDLDTKRKSLEALAATAGSDNRDELAMNRQFKQAQLGLAQQEVMRVNSDLLRVEAELTTLEAMPPWPDSALVLGSPASSAATDRELPEIQLAAKINRHPDMLKLATKAEDLNRRLVGIERAARKKNDPAVRQIRDQLGLLARQMQETRSHLRDSILQDSADVPKGLGAGPIVQGSDPARERTRLRVQADVLKGYKKALEESGTQLQSDIKALGRQGVDVVAQQEEINIATDFARKVGTELEFVRVELDAPPRVRILAKAKIPRPKDEHRKLRTGGAAAIGSLALALLGVSVWEFRAQRLDTPEELQLVLGLTLVGALPALPNRASRKAARALAQRNWQSLMVESIDAARTMLLHASRTQSIRVVQVSSAVEGEGKTSLASHLAGSLARAGRSTLLIDGDLRRPSVHRLFDLPAATGLCEVLRGEILAADAIIKTQSDGLDLLLAGLSDQLAMQALARGDLRHLLDNMKEFYEFILIDSAPLLSVTDSLVIGQDVDAVLFSVLRGVSKLPEVAVAHKRLDALGVRVLGAVMSGIPSTSYSSQYYGYATPEPGGSKS